MNLNRSKFAPRPGGQIGPQRQSFSGGAGDAPAKGGVKGRGMDPPVSQDFRRILHKKLGQLARGKPWSTTGYGSMAATTFPRGGEITQGGRPEPARGQRQTAAARNGQDTGPVSPSLVIDPKPGVALADVPVQMRRGTGHPAHLGRSAPSFMSGGRRARQAY